MKQIYYPNCSELIADFNVKDPLVFYGLLKALIERCQWQADPPVTLDYLKRMVRVKEMGGDSLQITLFDKKGNYTTVEYGPNGYDYGLGFYLDSGCNHYDTTQFRFFKNAVDICGAKVRAFDGGNLDSYEEWIAREGSDDWQSGEAAPEKAAPEKAAPKEN